MSKAKNTVPVFTVTINRAFKLQERLKEEMSAQAQIYRSSMVVTLKNPTPAQLQAEKMQDMHRKWEDAMANYFVASNLYMKIRAAVGEASLKTTGLLAELDQMKARETLFGGVLNSVNDPASIPVKYLEDYKQDLVNGKEGNNGPFHQNQVVMSLMTEDEKETLSAELESYRLRSFALQEQIAEANQQKITIVLSEGEQKMLEKLMGRG